MSIDPAIDRLNVQLDNFNDESQLAALLAGFEKEPTSVVQLHCTLGHWDRLKVSLLTLRAGNVAAIAVLAPSLPAATPDEVLAAIGFLRDWDQLFLQNILVLCEGWIPEELKKDFAIEAKMELKWFKEWFTASFDPRIAKYPGLPWRAFIRKVVVENYGFAEKLLAMAQAGVDGAEGVELRNYLRNFLRSRKKAVALFPKKWSRLQ